MFTFTVSNPAPLYQFKRDRGDVQMASTFVGALVADGDPRLGEFVAQNDGGSYVGSDPGSEITGGGISDMGPYVMSETSSSYMMSVAELHFAMAEAYFQQGLSAEAYQSYLDGAVASVIQVTGADPSGTAWYTGVLDIGAGALTLDAILYQKWLSLFGTPFYYNDWRRTDIPAFTPALNSTGGILLRFVYAQDAIDFNDNITQVSGYAPVWWDN
jgi:hypothetical protein